LGDKGIFNVKMRTYTYTLTGIRLLVYKPFISMSSHVPDRLLSGGLGDIVSKQSSDQWKTPISVSHFSRLKLPAEHYFLLPLPPQKINRGFLLSRIRRNRFQDVVNLRRENPL
jgi:hypothetical protein